MAMSWRGGLLLGIPLLSIVIFTVIGPIPQLAHYHEFADTRTRLGIPHFSDVVSNLGFLLVGCWGIWSLRDWHGDIAVRSAYRIFFLSVLATAFGSSFYHLAPDNSRLVWDRLPIALACTSLFLAQIGTRVNPVLAGRLLSWLLIIAIASVAWWRYTDLRGLGDLRAYLLVQCLPMALLPVLILAYPRSRPDSLGWFAVLGLYAAAKLAELLDAPLFHALGETLSGHSLKHLLATAAAAWVVFLVRAQDDTASASLQSARASDPAARSAATTASRSA